MLPNGLLYQHSNIIGDLLCDAQKDGVLHLFQNTRCTLLIKAQWSLISHTEFNCTNYSKYTRVNNLG